MLVSSIFISFVFDFVLLDECVKPTSSHSDNISNNVDIESALSIVYKICSKYSFCSDNSFSN